ncbi:transposase [Streptomyces sp. NPDC006622]|uniref:transposase n=1 Tax=Streptomyces sp. NPDC006622 TaxID=3155459 RepID=UPI0033A2C76C
MKTELESLATALHVKTDDLLKDSPQLAPLRPAVGIAPQLSDAELVTLAMMQAMLGFTSEARWLRHARAHLWHLFPYLPLQPGYNKRLRKASELIRRVTRTPAVDTTLWTDDVWVVDSTPVECGRSRETVKCSDLAGWAEYGYCASHSRFFWGLRLHLVCTLHGLPVAFALTGAKADERETLQVAPGRLPSLSPYFTSPSAFIQSSATWCGSSPATSTLAFSSWATTLSSFAVTGSMTSAMAGHFSKVLLLITGAAL